MAGKRHTSADINQPINNTVTAIGRGAGGAADTPPLGGVDIHVIGRAVHRKGNVILLFSGDGGNLTEYAFSSIGLDLALAAAASGDVVLLPAGTIPGDHTVPAGVEVVGRGRENTVLSGQITLGDGALLRDLSVMRVADQAEDLIGIVAPASGMAYVIGCNLAANNATGYGFACYGDLQYLTLRWCKVSAQSAGTDGNPFPLGNFEQGTEFDAFVVPSTDGDAYSGTVDTVVGEWYWVQVAGNIRWQWSENSRADPCYLTRDNWATIDAVGSFIRFLSPVVGQFYLFTNPLPAYSATHAYYAIVAGDGNPVSMRMMDEGQYYDNDGDWTVTVYSVTQSSASPYVYGCVIPNADGRAAAIPEWGDRAAWNTAWYGERHADDWTAGASHHAAVTLMPTADELLGLSGQEMSLDTQAANTVFAGPVSGTAAAPTFRAIVAADLGTGTPDGSRYLRDDLTWQEISSVTKASDLTIHYEPLTNGDGMSPALLFTPDGDCIMVEVSN